MHHNPKFIYLYTSPAPKKLFGILKRATQFCSFMLYFGTGCPKKVPFEINLKLDQNLCIYPVLDVFQQSLSRHGSIIVVQFRINRQPCSHMGPEHASREKIASAQNKNLRPLLNTNIPLISGKYGLGKHF